MGWLDALRGLAAITVVWWHLGAAAIVNLQDWHGQADFGKAGVVLFFLVSGYVIPMSLERYNDLRRFWISRILRLYPAWAVSVLLALAVLAAGGEGVPEPLSRDPLSVLLGHLSMTQGLLGIPNLVGVYWTLSYEMVFYLVVAGLFGLGLHRRHGWPALLPAGVALLAGPHLPGGVLTGSAGQRLPAAVVVLTGLVFVVIAAVSGRRALLLPASVLGVAMIALPLVNGRQSVRDGWQTLLMMAVMFAGTVIYRMHRGQMNRLAGAAVLAAVGGCWIAGACRYLPPGQERRVWIAMLVLAAAGFGVGFLMRHHSVPPLLTWLGRISYSVYLLHLTLLVVFTRMTPGLAERSLPVRILALVLYLVVTLGLAELVYRYVEVPAQNLGRRVVRRRAPLPTPRAENPAEAERKLRLLGVD
ncbi:acyltransferase [Actinoplanes sp. NPDC051851]|uniref:acyltransferase family protein n=1 Tax=Actinoplanes sp. NPDC051851 TaxID=3154753 RepID=UPI003436EF99